MAKKYGRPLSDLGSAYSFLQDVLELNETDAGQFCQKLSEAEELLAKRVYLDTLTSDQFRNPNYKTDDSRRLLRTRIFNELYQLNRLEDDEDISLGKGGAKPTTGTVFGKEAFLLIGPPASGKSTIASRLADANGAYIVDSDYAKRKFPEFDTATGASVLHKESSLVTFGYDSSEEHEEDYNLRDLLVAKGANIIVPKIGHNVQSVRNSRDELIEAGYTVHLILIRLDRQEACRRAFFRFLETRRYVNLGLVFDEYSNEPILTYYRCKNDSEWKSVTKICTAQLRDKGPDIVYTSFHDVEVLKSICKGDKYAKAS